MKPGDKIPTEQELAASFGVGRSSIREAMKVFSYLGIFESKTRRGTFLRGHSGISTEALTWAFILGHDDFRNLMEVRKALELEAWFILCEATGSDPQAVVPTIEALRHEADCMEKAITDRNEIELVEADFRFHRSAVAASGNILFTNLFDTLKSFTCEENLPLEYPAEFLTRDRHRASGADRGPREGGSADHYAALPGAYRTRHRQGVEGRGLRTRAYCFISCVRSAPRTEHKIFYDPCYSF